MIPTDEQIGRNVQKLRGEMSQTALADLMRERGFKWSQATVWAVEKGERPLRLAEAEALKDAFGNQYYPLAGDDAHTSLQLAVTEAAKAHRSIQQWSLAFMVARERIRELIDEATEDGESISAELADAVRGWLDQAPERAARDGVAMWEADS